MMIYENIKYVIHIVLTMWRTESERISCETGRASTNWIVIFGNTLRPQSTGIRARICAFFIYTRQMKWALGINNTFWSTRRWNASVFW